MYTYFFFRFTVNALWAGGILNCEPFINFLNVSRYVYFFGNRSPTCDIPIQAPAIYLLHLKENHIQRRASYKG